MVKAQMAEKNLTPIDWGGDRVYWSICKNR